MRRFVSTLGALGLVFRASIAAADPYNDAAQAWLSWVDHGQYAESWAAAGAYFRAAITKPAWEQAVKAARDPLGALKYAVWKAKLRPIRCRARPMANTKCCAFNLLSPTRPQRSKS